MKDYEPERQPSIEISTQASAEQHWQALDRSALGPRSVLLYAERLSEALDLRSMLSTGQIMAVQVAGDPAEDGAVLDFAFVQGLRKQCIAAEVPFHFAGTGANFQMKGRVFHIPAKLQASQAAKAEMEYFPICLAMNAPVPALAQDMTGDAAQAAKIGTTSMEMRKPQRSDAGRRSVQTGWEAMGHAPSMFDCMQGNANSEAAMPDADGFTAVSFNPFEDGEETAQENARPEDEDPTFFGSLEHPSVKNLHYTIEVSDDDDDYQGASAEDHRQLEESERARKSSAQVQFLQESLRLAEDGGHP
ncbi:MAG: hypothetical protein Q4Q21_08495 [Lachnospiraceae bacterium]|nr:hypothetical protein [Lachnospiraceae bacterium]